jgi:hypothetical protein
MAGGSAIDSKINPANLQPADTATLKKSLSALVFDDELAKASASSAISDKWRSNDAGKIRQFKNELVELFGDMEFELENRNGA